MAYNTFAEEHIDLPQVIYDSLNKCRMKERRTNFLHLNLVMSWKAFESVSEVKRVLTSRMASGRSRTEPGYHVDLEIRIRRGGTWSGLGTDANVLLYFALLTCVLNKSAPCIA
jgi:hypothetical protein